MKERNLFLANCAQRAEPTHAAMMRRVKRRGGVMVELGIDRTDDVAQGLLCQWLDQARDMVPEAAALELF